MSDFDKAPPFTHEKNITVGKARVIWAEAIMFRTHEGWVLPGGKRTTDYMEAQSMAVMMNEVMA